MNSDKFRPGSIEEYKAERQKHVENPVPDIVKNIFPFKSPKKSDTKDDKGS